MNYFGSSLLNNGESTEYVTIYQSNDSGVTISNIASQNNYEVNTKIYGDAIRETSTAGTGTTSWYKNYSAFPGYSEPFFKRGGRWYDSKNIELFYFSYYDGASAYNMGFRVVLVTQ